VLYIISYFEEMNPPLYPLDFLDAPLLWEIDGQSMLCSSGEHDHRPGNYAARFKEFLDFFFPLGPSIGEGLRTNGLLFSLVGLDMGCGGSLRG
jgi:hypothetical protein